MTSNEVTLREYCLPPNNPNTEDQGKFIQRRIVQHCQRPLSGNISGSQTRSMAVAPDRDAWQAHSEFHLQPLDFDSDVSPFRDAPSTAPILP